MPLLRHLNISRNTVQHMVHINDGNLDKPHLPLLEHFWIDGGDPVTICLLLESITLPPGQNALQTLRLPTFHEMSQEGSQARERLHHAITKWIHSYMASFASPRLTLIDSEPVLSLIDVPQTEHEGMQVELPYSDNHSHFTIQSIANCPRLSFVEDLTVYMASGAHWPLQPLYEALQSVTYLTVGGQGMGTLFHDMQQFSLFPHLLTIEIYSAVDGTVNDDRSGEESVIPAIIHFLEHRVSIGRPLFMLDLSSLNIDGVSHTNLERLIDISCLLLKLPGDDWDD
ncbi:hypothetical protein CPC08DRAFT_197276 [Agrocybe pediades]|nr:hypothetical protein CPC08DRAFT_197276 [Agrocybe pediades]